MTRDQRLFLAFRSQAAPDEAWFVESFSGEEALSRPYRFEILFTSPDPSLDLDAMLRRPASLEILDVKTGEDGERLYGSPRRIHGKLEAVQQKETRDTISRYSAILVPRLWNLSLSYRSRIFLEKKTFEIVGEVLKENGITEEEFEFRLADRNRYARREYVVQYEETDLDFVSRWLEHEGIFYYFEQAKDRERIIFSDGVDELPFVREEASLRFQTRTVDVRPDWHEEETVETFSCRKAPSPARVILKDYNWRKPSLDLQCSATVNGEGVGVLYEYNNHYKTKEEGEALAKVRAEEILCRTTLFQGTGVCRAFRAGATWDLRDHPRPDMNAGYCLTRVRHAARQETIREGALSATYSNEFECIPAGRAFRPERLTRWPTISGTIHGRVDAGGDGRYAELDGEGRYKVKLPLDLSDRAEGRASRYLRMAQPYAGSDHGMHFPLHKGTEVLITHIDGDPDRPIITGVVAGANATSAGVKTAGGNELSMEDQEGHQRIFLRAGSGNSAIVIGAGSEDRIDISSKSTAVSSTLNSVYSLLLNDQIGALGASITSGFPLLQVGLFALKQGTSIVANNLLSPALKKAGWPAAAATGTTTLVALSGTLAGALIKKKFMTAKMKTIVDQQSVNPAAPVQNKRWYSVFQKGWSGFKDFTTGVGTGGFGGYFIRCGGGTRLDLKAIGEAVLLASEKGKLVLYGADDGGYRGLGRRHDVAGRGREARASGAGGGDP